MLALTNLFMLTLLFPKGETEAWVANALQGQPAGEAVLRFRSEIYCCSVLPHGSSLGGTLPFPSPLPQKEPLSEEQKLLW